MSPHSHPQILVVGSYVQACCWQVERLPRAGETLAAAQLWVEPGGKGLNVAVGLARLAEPGARVSVLMACGSDSAGDCLQALLAAEGIDGRHLARLPGHSGMGCGLVGPGGENQIVVYPGANALLGAGHADAAAAQLASAAMVYAQLEAALPAVERALAMAAAAGAVTVLNPSPWREPSPALREATQVLIVNQAEATALLGVEPGTGAGLPGQLLQRLAWQWPRLTQLLLTQGPRGSLGFERAAAAGHWQGWQVDACAVDAVDAVGAGDAFAAAYMSAQLSGCGMAQSMQRAQRCAAQVVAGAGVLARLPRREQLRPWLEDGSLPAARPLGPGRR